MRSEAVRNITGARALKLLKGAALWRASLDARGDIKEGIASARWRAWLNRFEPDPAKQTRVYEHVSEICRAAYTASLDIGSRGLD
jgi:hypothetical protein